VSGSRDIVFLVLFNNHVARTGTHLTTFVVGHNNIVAPALTSGIRKVSGSETEVSRNLSGGNSGRRKTRGGPSDEDILKISKFKLQFDVIIGESSRGESNTAIASVEEGDGDVESVGRLTSARGDKSGDITDHLIVTILLTSGIHKSGPPVKVETGDGLDFQVIEEDVNFLDEVVTDIGGPRDATWVIRTGVCNRGEFNTKPGAEKIVSGSGDGKVSGSSE
jgi:hypothetical protein